MNLCQIIINFYLIILIGCGALLHCQDKNHEGFISADLYSKLNKAELKYTYCLRCQLLNDNKKLLNFQNNKFDYDELILKKICDQKRAHVILLVDLCDIPNSIYDGWIKLITCKNYIDFF